jgi:hypothetical protein
MANTSRKKRATTILTDMPVKAALRDKQNLKQVTKEKHIRRGARGACLITPHKILRRRI